MKYSRHSALTSGIWRVCIVAFLLRIGLAVYLYNYDLADGGNGIFTGYDDALYWRIGESIASDWRLFGLFSQHYDMGQTLHAYFYVNAVFSYAFGDTGLLVLLALNALIGSVLVYLSYLIGRYIDTESTGLFAAWLVALLPRLVFWSSLNYRDVYLALFILVTIYGSSNVTLSGVRFIAIAIVGLVGTFLFRPWQGIVLAVALVFLALITAGARNSRTVSKRAAGLVFILLLGVLIWGGSSLDSAWQQVSYFFQGQSDIVYQNAQDVSSANSLFSPYFSAGVLGRALLAPFSIIISLIYPFPPWLMTGALVRDIETISNWFWYFLIPGSLYGTVSLLRLRSNKGFVTAFLTAFVFLAYQTGGPITVPRTAYPLHVLYMVLAAYGIRHMPNAGKWAFVSFGVIVAFSVVYLALKG